jgi:hypothetical protein
MNIEKLFRKVNRFYGEGLNVDSITNNVIATYDVTSLIDEFNIIETGNVFDDVKQAVIEILSVKS